MSVKNNDEKVSYNQEILNEKIKEVTMLMKENEGNVYASDSIGDEKR